MFSVLHMLMGVYCIDDVKPTEPEKSESSEGCLILSPSYTLGYLLLYGNLVLTPKRHGYRQKDRFLHEKPLE